VKVCAELRRYMGRSGAFVRKAVLVCATGRASDPGASDAPRGDNRVSICTSPGRVVRQSHESAHRPARSDYRLSTKGNRMTGGSPAAKPLIGAVLGLAIAAFSGGEAMALAPAVRVWTADGECAREVLLNGGFEQIKDDKALGWEPVEHGYSVAEGAGRDGGTAIHCRNDDGVARLAARQLIELNQTRPLAVVIRGWSRAENVDGDPGIDYSLYTDRLHQDGSWTYGQTANFSTGTHAWEYREVTIIPAKPIKTLAIHALLRGYSGQAWFDDISVREMSTGGAGIFDTVPIRVPEPQPDTAKSAGVTTTTPDGLAMGYHRPTGRVTSLTLDGEDLVVAGVPSGFLVRDVAAGSHIYAFEHGNCAPLGLARIIHESQARKTGETAK